MVLEGAATDCRIADHCNSEEIFGDCLGDVAACERLSSHASRTCQKIIMWLGKKRVAETLLRCFLQRRLFVIQHATGKLMSDAV